MKANHTVYLFPGQGSDSAIFGELQLDSQFTKKVIEYPVPRNDDSMKSYAIRLIKQMDTSKPFSIIGVSFGGMLCTELADILSPSKVILVSSAKNKFELPKKYHIQEKLKVYKLLSAETFKRGAQILQPIVEPDRNKKKAEFKGMLKRKDPKFLRGSVRLILSWDRTDSNADIYHIHGNLDNTLPIENVNADCILKDGSHMMMLTRSEEVSEIINRKLTED